MDELIKEIKGIDNQIYVAGHKNPDFDSLCSTLALGLILKSLNKQVNVYMNGKDQEEVEYFKCDSIITNNILGESFILIALDLNTKDRLEDEVFKNLNKACRTINIDHHQGNKTNFDLVLSMEDISSTSEIVYEIMIGLNIKGTKTVKELLLTGIISDTEMFIKNTSKRTLEIVEDLIYQDIDKEYLINKFYLSKTENQLKIISKLINGLKHNKIHYIIIKMKKSPYNKEKEINIQKKCLPVVFSDENIKILILIMKYGKRKKVSVRTKGNIDASKIAGLFNGGGHRNAAGFTSTYRIGKIIKIINESL